MDLEFCCQRIMFFASLWLYINWYTSSEKNSWRAIFMALLTRRIKNSIFGNVSWLKLIPSALIGFDSAGCQNFKHLPFWIFFWKKCIQHFYFWEILYTSLVCNMNIGLGTFMLWHLDMTFGYDLVILDWNVQHLDAGCASLAQRTNLDWNSFSWMTVGYTDLLFITWIWNFWNLTLELDFEFGNILDPGCTCYRYLRKFLFMDALIPLDW